MNSKIKKEGNLLLEDWSYYITRVSEFNRKITDALNARDYEEAKFFAGELTIASANLGASIDAAVTATHR